MIPQTHQRNIIGSSTEKSRFGIAVGQQAHIMRILRDTMYSDKILAVLREYSSNAWDAHCAYNLSHVPIKVTLPMASSPTLVIRDFGPGLSKQDALFHFTQFGASSKRGFESDCADCAAMPTDEFCDRCLDADVLARAHEANERAQKQVGSLGVGCKAGHAYSDTFTITSWFEGTKSVYIAVIDASDEGEMRLVHEEPCGDETGLEIKIAVLPSDVTAFHDRARNLFRYFEPRPDINIHLPVVQRHNFKEGFLTEDYNNGWTAIMGCVPYRLDLNQVKELLEDMGLWDCLHSISGGVYFPIGAVQFNAGREELRYSSATRKAIVDQLKALVDEYVEDTLATLADPDADGWSKRLKANYLSRRLRLDLPSKYKDWCGDWVILHPKDSPYVPVGTKFRVTTHEGKLSSRVTVSEHSCIYIKDDQRRLAGFAGLSKYTSLIVSPFTTEDGWRAELDTLLKNARVDGIPIIPISTLQWFAPTGKSGRVPNEKHSVATFRLKPGYRSINSPLSDNWVVEQRKPTDDDVFVIIRHFKPLNQAEQWYDLLNQDRDLAEKFGLTFPTIYGYKTTIKREVLPADCKGTPYMEWRKELFKGCVTRKWVDLRRADDWATILKDPPYYPRGVYTRETFPTLAKQLGKDHPVVQFFKKRDEGIALIRRSFQDQNTCRALWARIGRKNKRKTPPELALDSILEKYPLLKTVAKDVSLWAVTELENLPGWVEYIRLKDDAVSS